MIPSSYKPKKKFMELAIAEARLAGDRGDYPIGAVITRVADDLGVGWVERSIEDDPVLKEQYWEQIPVTFVDGRQHDYWRVDETRLRAALTR